MRFSTLIAFLLFFYANVAAQSSQQITDARTVLDINADWQFVRGEQGEEVTTAAYDDSAWETVTVPHTMELVERDFYHLGDKPTQDFFQRYIGYYRKKMDISLQSGQRALLEFEGAHQATKCWVNGKLVGEHATSGFTPFHFDITNYVVEGQETSVVLSVDNRKNADIPPDGDKFDYILFSGLYRDVYLQIVNPVHVTFNWESLESGIFITTPSVSKENATVSVRTGVRNEGAESAMVRVESWILDAEGRVERKVIKSRNIVSEGHEIFTHTTSLADGLRLWSPDDPYLYTLQTRVFHDDELSDVRNTRFGIRKIEFVDGRGMLLNGEPIELLGANKHQAYPYIGDAVPNSLLVHDAVQIKASGMNVIRLAHYPHDNAFVEACDELGILLMEEAPTWIEMRRGKYFENLLESTRVMIRNHRNSPSIFSWSAGINHRGPVEQLHHVCKEEDPTRATGSNGSTWTGPRNSGIADIYTPMDYENAPLEEEDFSFLCEHASSADSKSNQFEVSKSRKSANRFGVALWTAHDYISFNKDWGLQPRRPWSTFRVERPLAKWYESEMIEKPIVYIADERTSVGPEVHIFSNATEVELFNNGKLVARQGPDSDPLRAYCKHPSFSFLLEDERGDLKAVGYRNGAVMGEYEHKLPGQEAKISLRIEDDGIPFYANGSDMKMVHAEIQDADGNVVRLVEKEVTFVVEGAGDIVGGVEIGANPSMSFYGTSSAILRAVKAPGVIKVTASAPGLEPATAEISTEKYERNKSVSGFVEVIDYPQVNIDLGKKGQYMQFEWDAWSEGTHKESAYGASLNVAATSGDEEWTTMWGNVSAIAYTAMDGVLSEEGKGLELRIQDLPKGTYMVRTIHHLMTDPKIDNNVFPIPDKKNYAYLHAVDDAKGAREISGNIKPSIGNRLKNKFPAERIFYVYSDGSGDVKVTMKSNTSNLRVALNGVRIRKVAE